MKISPNTKISELIKHDLRAIEAIASINSHFEKLRNPLLRKILASRVTINDAAKIGKCSVSVFFDKLREIGFKTEGTFENVKEIQDVSEVEIEERGLVTLDVRQDLASGRDPFLKIMHTLKEMEDHQILLLLNSFGPIPLIKILAEKGYACNVRNEGTLVKTFIKRLAIAQAIEISDRRTVLTEKDFQGKIVDLDVRTLEMPGPMLAILDALDSLPVDSALHVYHRKVPQLLIPELNQRGFDIQIDEVSEGNVELLIRRHVES